MAIKEEGVSFATLLRDMHKDNPLCEDVQKNMEQERLKEILDDIASGRYSYDNPTIIAEVRGLLGLPATKQNKLRYIGIIGSQGSGKDYVGRWLQQNIQRPSKVVKFATKLTEVTAAVLGVDDLSLFQNREWKEQPHFIWQSQITNNNGKLISPREAQQIIGTDICRQLLGADVWVRALATSCQEPDTLYIVTDVRFQNEMQYIQQNNGVVVYVDNRKAAQEQHRKESGVVHESEQLMWSMHYGAVLPDYVFNNNDYNDKQPLQDLITFLSTVV